MQGRPPHFPGSMVIRSAYDIQLEFNPLQGYRKTPLVALVRMNHSEPLAMNHSEPDEPFEVNHNEPLLAPMIGSETAQTRQQWPKPLESGHGMACGKSGQRAEAESA